VDGMEPPPSTDAARAAKTAIEQKLVALRPKLHRYCARMTGSVIDGEDVVQEALVKAIEGMPDDGSLLRPEGWILRIAHNAALDFLRRRIRHEAMHVEAQVEAIADPGDAVWQRQIAGAGLATFMRLPVAQRSAVILKDVLGYSLEEICHLTEMTLPAVKAALHRGRGTLRAMAGEPQAAPGPALSGPELSRLADYVTRFNARDFDAVRDMLAEDVRLDLVGHGRRHGKREVGTYFSNYAGKDDWHLAPGAVDGRPAALVFDPRAADPRPAYFVLLAWENGHLAAIRDFRYARHVAADAVVWVPGPALVGLKTIPQVVPRGAAVRPSTSS